MSIATEPRNIDHRLTRFLTVVWLRLLRMLGALIVGEAPGTVELRERLINFGANVHVVSIAGATLLLQQKQIDTAFIAASLEHANICAVHALDALVDHRQAGAGACVIRRLFTRS